MNLDPGPGKFRLGLEGLWSITLNPKPYSLYKVQRSEWEQLEPQTPWTLHSISPNSLKSDTLSLKCKPSTPKASQTPEARSGLAYLLKYLARYVVSDLSKYLAQCPRRFIGPKVWRCGPP